MVLAMMLALVQPAASLAPGKDASLEEQFTYAARCRVHSDLLPAMAKNAAGVKHAEAVKSYWYKESDRLGKKLGHKGEALEMQYLIHPITADLDFILSCVDQAIGAAKK